MDLTNKTILIIGGTGSFGTAFLHYLLDHHPGVARVIIFSRDEQKQFDLANNIDAHKKNKVTFFIGDIRDRSRVDEVMHGVNIVIHAAAMKHVPITQANPEECYKTNVIGTQNVVDLALAHKVEKVLALSTDKAVMPINAYGASKLFLEKIVVHANESPRNEGTKLCVVRYANVLGSRGSVVPFFQKMKATGELPITDLAMTRFSITLQQALDIVIYALQNFEGGEVFVPRAPSYKITTVAEAICPKCRRKQIGMRSGEKLSELMTSRFEATRVIEKEKCYIVLPDDGRSTVSAYISKNGGKPVDQNFEYDSETNSDWLSVDELKKQIDLL